MYNRFAVCMLVACMISFLACKPSERPADENEADIVAMIEDDTTTYGDEDCPRSPAEPIVKKNVYSDSNFSREENNHAGIETFTTQKGDRVSIRNWGCEYIVLTFRIETSRFTTAISNVAEWYSNTAILMTEIEQGINAPFNINEGTTFIQQYGLQAQVAIGDDLVVSDDAMQSTVTLDSVEELGNGVYAVEITYAFGPL